jgi:hypothetical protein
VSFTDFFFFFLWSQIIYIFFCWLIYSFFFFFLWGPFFHFGETARFQYRTVDQVLEDLKLMHRNAELFNGVKSPVANDAKVLLDSITLLLTHDRLHLGADKDELAVLEVAIKKKYCTH